MYNESIYYPYINYDQYFDRQFPGPQIPGFPGEPTLYLIDRKLREQEIEKQNQNHSFIMACAIEEDGVIDKVKSEG